MPANPKYLTASAWQRFAKISAAILGGYLVASGLHLMAASWWDRKLVLLTFSYSLFIIWTPLLFLPFLFKNGWRCWLYYLVVLMICAVGFFTGNSTI